MCASRTVCGWTSCVFPDVPLESVISLTCPTGTPSRVPYGGASAWSASRSCLSMTGRSRSASSDPSGPGLRPAADQRRW